MIEELDVVALTRDISGTYLKRGDLGTVVLVYGKNEAYMVEFVVQTGFTAALMDVEADDVRSLERSELDRKRYREWKPEWTDGKMGYVPVVSEMADWDISPDGRRPDAHYLACVDGAGRRE